MKIDTKKFGKIDIDKNCIIKFKEGIIGFEDLKEFTLLDFLKDSPFKWLQSLEDPSVAFVVCDPWQFFKDYKPEIGDDQRDDIYLAEGDPVTLFSIATVPNDITKASLNLLSPVIINPKKMIGKQIILYNSKYNTKHSIFKVIKVNKEKKQMKE